MTVRRGRFSGVFTLQLDESTQLQKLEVILMLNAKLSAKSH